ncbi:hypothetical protein B4N89_27975 [Embleya scabrispora]|uniref:DUF4352 domain-containing protein n=1 Tax=Embleya scabrispora TaxID=159449 RepID=A0A1T3P586_9ACTN|nr:hypothetical protein [Embleya scabrispora]OPC84257.1 hypothetical protein B4N89_27975 [Embleya scabrispora]
MYRRTVAAGSAALLALVLASCSSDGGSKTSTSGLPAPGAPTEPPGTIPAAQASPVGLGQPFVLPGLEVTTTVQPVPVFTGARASTPEGQVNAEFIPAGSRPVMVRVAVANTGQAPFDLSKVFVRDMVGTTSGGKANYTDLGNVREEPFAGSVAPGSTGSGAVGYVVPGPVASAFRITVAMQPGFGGPFPDVVVTGSLPAS